MNQLTKEKIAAYKKKYRAEHKDKIAATNKDYYQRHKEEISKSNKEYRETPIGRASRLISTYNQTDKQFGRGKGDLTARWIVENIFTKPCTHCGETDWTRIGCNRLDNSKPHTMDNVEPCCGKCNAKMAGVETSKQVGQYTFDGELIKIWNSTTEAEKNGFRSGNISLCCNGKRNTHNGYKWSYI